MSYEIINADVLEWAKSYEGEPFHAILCDPPYHLTTPVVGWETYKRDNPQGHAAGTIRRDTAGFMGKKWDGGDVAYRPATWAALARHLHPGGFIMAFASSRGWHRLACAIEDAGLIIHPSIFGYCYGSGFPKSTRIERDSAANLFCQCVDSRPQSQPRAQSDNAPDGSGIDEGYRDDCSPSRRQCDAQLRLVEVSAQGDEPLRGDAPTRSHSDGPLADSPAGNEPSRNPSRVQDSDRQHNSISQDEQELSDGASQLSQGLEGATCHGCGSLSPSTASSRIAQGLPLTGEGDDRLVCHKSSIDSSGDGSPSGSLDTPSIQSCAHDTTETRFCQMCGKIKKGVWSGHRYGLQAMKPSLEPIIVAQKPYAGKPVDSITETGAGALWIDGGRIGTGDKLSGGNCVGAVDQVSEGWDRPWRHDANYVKGFAERARKRVAHAEKLGRWPSNLYLCHTPECERIGTRRVGSGDPRRGPHSSKIASRCFGAQYDHETLTSYGLETVASWRCVESCPVRRLGAQSGVSVSKAGGMGGLDPGMWQRKKQGLRGGHNDSGTCARFFFNADWSHEVAERLATCDPVRYVAKAGRKERDEGLEAWRRRPAGAYVMRNAVDTGRDPTKPGNAQMGGQTFGRNRHPTVKPIALTRWLATLLLPPELYAPRRILVPFAGSGSEMIGALLAGWESVTGVEMEVEYVEIAEARLAHWASKPIQKVLF